MDLRLGAEGKRGDIQGKRRECRSLYGVFYHRAKGRVLYDIPGLNSSYLARRWLYSVFIV